NSVGIHESGSKYEQRSLFVTSFGSRQDREAHDRSTKVEDGNPQPTRRTGELATKAIIYCVSRRARANPKSSIDSSRHSDLEKTKKSAIGHLKWNTVFRRRRFERH